jgi:hypothetical protein
MPAFDRGHEATLASEIRVGLSLTIEEHHY